MQLSVPQGAAFVRHHEGFVDHWYLDPVKVPTIGIGFTWASKALRKWWAEHRPGVLFAAGATMTRDEADTVLSLLFAEEYGPPVTAFLGDVEQHVFDGTASTVFNCGAGTLGDKWASALKAGDIHKAATLLKTTRITAKGKKLPGLVSRRREEAELIKAGDYTVGAVYTNPLADGMLVRKERGQPVIDLQDALARRGLYAGKADGLFGYGTEAAVLAFQRLNGLVADGKAGTQTLKALAA